jgi:hypothetical protein
MEQLDNFKGRVIGFERKRPRGIALNMVGEGGKEEN